jgi:hypothetical protein
MTRNSITGLGLATFATLGLTVCADAQTVSAAKNVDIASSTATPAASVTNAIVTQIVPGSGTTATAETFLLQDSTGALEVYKLPISSTTYTPAVGDIVSVSGDITSFHGLFELETSGTTTVTASKTGTAVSLPQPSVFTTPGLTNGSTVGNAQQSTLGNLSGVTFTGATGSFASGVSYTVTNAAGSAIVYVGTGSPLIGQAIPTGLANVYGYLGQYDTAATTFGSGASSTNGYELDPLSVTAAPEPSSVAAVLIGTGLLVHL